MSAHDEEVLGKAYDARLMRRLLGYVRPYRGMALGALLLIVASSLLQLLPSARPPPPCSVCGS